MTGSFGFGAAGSSPPDIRVQNHGTLYLLFPISPAGEHWLCENTAKDATWWGRALGRRAPLRRRHRRRRAG